MWDARIDRAIGDNACFRVRVVPDTPTGPVDQSGASAISPPFQVRGLSCDWPTDPAMTITGTRLVSQTVRVDGMVNNASGSIGFIWDFGDGSPLKYGQFTIYKYTRNGIYTIKLAVSGEACPVARPVFASLPITITGGSDGTVTRTRKIFIPLAARATTTLDLQRSLANGLAISEVQEPSGLVLLRGQRDSTTQRTTLSWDAPTDVRISGYWLYRQDVTQATSSELVASLSATTNTYTLDANDCGHAYYLTLMRDGEAWAASASSYFTPACAVGATQ